MPALISHYILGEKVMKDLDQSLFPDTDAVNAFLIGCQGPDPFFFRFSTTKAQEAHRLAHAMHSGRMSATFDNLFAGIDHLRPEDKTIGRAFVAGMLTHYALDRSAHPFVYAQQYALTAIEEELSDAESELHAIIESDIDSAVLLTYHGQTTDVFSPVTTLEASQRVLWAAGALLSYAADSVYDIKIPVTEYESSVKNMRTIYSLIEPAGSVKLKMLSLIERTGRSHSHLAALTHRSDIPMDHDSVNPQHYEWIDPFTGTQRSESFYDLFENAQDDAVNMVGAFLAGDDGCAIAGHKDYSGEVLDSDEVPLDFLTSNNDEDFEAWDEEDGYYKYYDLTYFDDEEDE